MVYNLASLYEQTAKHDEAIALYQRLIDRDAKSLTAINNLAMLLVTYKDDKQSHAKAKDLIQALKESDNPAYLDTTGWVYYQNSEYDVAISYLQRAVAMLPGQPLLRYHLGMAYYSSGNNKLAIDNLKSAIASDVNFSGKAQAEQTLKKIST